MSFTLNLGKVSIDGSTLKYTNEAVDSVNVSISGGKATFKDLGLLTLANDNLTFKADKAVTGKFSFTGDQAYVSKVGDASVDVSAIDFSEANAVEFDAKKSAITSILGSNGNDKLYSSATEAVTIEASKGDDVITFSGTASASINSGAGNDKVKIDGNGVSVSIADETGDDVYTITGDSVKATIDDKAGNDELKITGKKASVDVAFADKGDNVINIDSAATEAVVSITGGDGSDVLTSKAAKASIVASLDDGDNVVTISGKTSYASITTGTGDDVIDIVKGADNTTVDIATGAKDDTIKISAVSVTGSINGKEGNDTLVISGANASLAIENVEEITLTGKSSWVSLGTSSITSSATGASITGGAVTVTGGSAVLTDVDSLTLTGGSVLAKTSIENGVVISGGTFISDKDVDGVDEISITGSGAVVSVGAGDDEILITDEATGTNTLALGAGADSVTIAAGTGKVVITDLDSANDVIVLDGADEVPTAVLTKDGKLTVKGEEHDLTANVISGDVTKDDGYDTKVKNKAKNNYLYATVQNEKNEHIDLYTATGTTKKVEIDASDADGMVAMDLSAAKSSAVSVVAAEDQTAAITLGSGEDKVSIGSVVGKVNITGYNFANKDAIKYTADGAILHDDGVLTFDIEADETDYDDSKVVVSTTANNNVYAARVNTTDYYTAKTGAVKIATDKEIGDNVIDVAKASSSTINVTNGYAFIKSLTTGADIINVTKGASVKGSMVEDKEALYNYAEGDVINIGKDKVSVNASNIAIDGKLTITGKENTSVQIATTFMDNGLAAAKVVSENNKKTNTYAVAAEDASINIDLSASSFGDVFFDGQNAADVNVAIGAGDWANLSDGEDTITVNGLSKTTKEVVDIHNFNTEEDKLVLSNIKLTDLSISSVGASVVSVNYGSKKAGVHVTLTDTVDSSVALNINGTDVKAAVADGATLTLDADSKDAFFLGRGKDDSITSLNVADVENMVIDLADTNKYNNIHNVVVEDGASGIAIIGTDNKKVAEKVDASANSEGIQVLMGAGNDTVSLSAGADVVWFNAKQGKDNIANFTYGNGENADVLYLTDVTLAGLSKVKITTDDGAVSVKDGSAYAYISTNTPDDENASEIMQVQLSDNKIYNVAMDLDNTEGITLNLDDEVKVDTYVGKKVVLKSSDAVAYTYADKGIEAIDGAETNGAMTIVGVKNVTLGSSEEINDNKVWAKGVAASINASSSTAGNDQVWFQSGVDKKVLVEGFADYDADNDANDNIKLVGTKSMADIVSNYKFSVKNDNMVITGASSAASALTVSGQKTVVLTTDNDDVSYVAAVAGSDDSFSFTSDVQIYAGMKELSASDIDVDTVILLDGGSSTTFDLKSDYYIGSSVKNFDAKGSSANLVIVGSKTAKNELTGGDGDDLIYGGGASNDTMKGGEGSNTFFYGANDGKDVIEDITENDTINLYSGNLVDLGYKEDKDAYIFTFEGGNTLTVNGDLADGAKVQYAGATFVYQKDDHTFIQA